MANEKAREVQQKTKNLAPGTIILAGDTIVSIEHHVIGKPKNTMSGIKETKPLAEIDPEMFELIQQEYNRQTGGLELIASEVRHLPPR